MTFYAENYTVIYTSSFEEELDYTVKYIAFKLKEPNIANQFYHIIKSKTNSLHYFPERHVKIIFKNKIYRKLLINKYIVIYEVDNNTRTSLYFTYFSCKSKLFKSIIN